MGWQSDSQLFRPPRLVICNSGISKGIQFAGSNIFFNLPVPCLCIELLIPSTELSQLILGQLGYRLFNLLNGSHHIRTSAFLSRRWFINLCGCDTLSVFCSSV